MNSHNKYGWTQPPHDSQTNANSHFTSRRPCASNYLLNDSATAIPGSMSNSLTLAP